MPPISMSKAFWLTAALCALSPAALAHDGEKHKTTAEPAAPAIAAATAGIQIEVKDGWLVSGPEIVKVSQGDEVVISITSNHADELHLHGYDITVPLKANTPATLSFTAKYPGRFGYELHHAHREIGAIEVHP